MRVGYKRYMYTIHIIYVATSPQWTVVHMYCIYYYKYEIGMISTLAAAAAAEAVRRLYWYDVGIILYSD